MTSIGSDTYIGQNEVDNYAWPLTITFDTRITISENITLSNTNQYFIVGGPSVIIDGGNFTITVSNVNGYPGLVKNGGYSYQSSIATASADAYANVTIQNIIVEASTSCLAGIVSNSTELDGTDYNNGWICQAFFGNGANVETVSVYNCSTNGNTYSYNTEGTYYYINPDDSSITTHSGQITAVSGGCILGDYSYAIVEHCYSTGAIGDSSYNKSCGGIFGNYCKGKAINCSSSGAIANYSGGIFGENTVEYAAALWCYSSGTITNNAGGIFGVNPGGHSIARNCHSTGNISSNSGGIFAPGTGYATAMSCYSTGSIDNNSGGIFGNYNSGSNAFYCYSTGAITNNSAGIAGYYYQYGIYILGCYSSGNIDSTSYGIMISDSNMNAAYGAIYNSYSTGTYENDNGIANNGNIVECYSANGSWSDDDANSESLNHRNNWVSFSNNSPWKFSKQYITQDITITNDDLYTTTSVDSTKAYCWPLYIGENVTITIGSDMTLYNPSQYIQINGANSSVEGGKYTITVKGVNGYPGLVKNGSFAYYGQDDGTTKIGNGYGAYDNVTVQNVIVNATDSCLASLVYDSTNENSNDVDECGSGWICHAFYGSGLSNYETLIVENCSTNGNTYTYDGANNYYYISPVDKITIKRHESHGTISGGCIMGDYSIAVVLNCYSTGAIGDAKENMFAGGIMGRFCCGKIINCYSTGAITNESGGIIGGHSHKYDTIITNIQWCYSTGTITGSSGGIYGGSAGENSRAIHCYSTGAISGSSGGIFGKNTYFTNASCCYSTGSIDNNSGGIFAQNNSYFSVETSYSTGPMSNNSGGIVSSYSGASTGNIYGCYSTGSIDGTSCGIFINEATTTSVNIIGCYSTGSISDGGNGIANYGTMQYCYSANNNWSDTDATTAQLNHNGHWTIVTSDTPWKFAAQYITSDITIYENMSYYFNATYYVWPIYIIAENVTVNIVANSGLVIYNRNQYIEIQNNNTTINGDGGNVTIYRVGGYPGLVKNGGYYYDENGYVTASANAYSNTIVQNIGINAVNSYLLAISMSNVLFNVSDDKIGTGWVCHAYYGNGGSNNSIQNCSSNGSNITKYWLTTNGVYDTNNGNTYGGCMVGDYSNVNVTNSYSTGEIGNGGGGIYGKYASGNATSCYSTGVIGTQAGGIFGSTSSGNATSCYSMGTIAMFAGGILASGSSGNATSCYSTGTIGNFAGGILGEGCSGSANNCYSTGTIGNGTEGIIGGMMMHIATANNCYSANGTWSDSNAFAAGMYKSDATGVLWLPTSDTVNTPWKLAAFNKAIFDNYSITISNSQSESIIQTLNDYGKKFANVSLFQVNGSYTNISPFAISNYSMIHTSSFSFDSITQKSKTFIIGLYAYNTDSTLNSIDNVLSYSFTSFNVRVINASPSIRLSSNPSTLSFIKDINPGTGSSNIAYLTDFNGKIIFTATNDSTGRELWITDGTTEGTNMVKDINSGTIGSDPYNFTAFNNKLLFAAYTDTDGTELWITDGTESGTQMVKNINSGSDSGAPISFTVIGDKVVFNANNGTNGIELWVTDGTEMGTQLLKDINEGSGHGYPYSFTVLNDQVIFGADNGNSEGVELWITDGTESGTKLLKDIYPGTNSSYPNNYIIYNNGYENRLFFTANTSVGKELWITDGTTTGTYLVKDINSGSSSTDMMNFVIFNNGTGNKLLFNATTTTNGAELWISDGTADGTTMVKDIYPGESYGYPVNLTVFHDGTAEKVLFTANTAEYGYELWVTDGTENGTTMVKDLYEGTEGSTPNTMFVFNNGSSEKVLFSAINTTNDNNIWITDGTNEGTFILKQLDPEIIPYDPSMFYIYNDGKQKVLFNARSNNNIYNELWITDGTLEGTSRVSTSPFNVNNFKAIGNKIVFIGSTNETGDELWCYTHSDSTDYVDDISLFGTAPASSNVKIQYSLDGVNNWTDITTITASQDGQWSYTYSPSNGHTHYVRAYETTGGNMSSSVMVTYTEPEPQPEPEPGPIVSNICFAKNTPIETDQGIFPIQKLVPDMHTINGNPIRHITKTTHSKKYLIKICKHALGHNIPNQDTILSDYHKVLYNDSMMQAQQLLGIEGVEKIDYNGEILYNVLLDTYEMIRVNNMTAETLHPKNTTARLYRKMMGEDVTVEARQKYIMQLTTININIDYKDIIIHYGTNHAIEMELCNSVIVMDDDISDTIQYNLTHHNRYKGIRISVTKDIKPFIEEDVPLVIGKTQINQSIGAKVSLQIKNRPVRRRIKK